jgi:hypothetical protein
MAGATVGVRRRFPSSIRDAALDSARLRAGWDAVLVLASPLALAWWQAPLPLGLRSAELRLRGPAAGHVRPRRGLGRASVGGSRPGRLLKLAGRHHNQRTQSRQVPARWRQSGDA